MQVTSEFRPNIIGNASENNFRSAFEDEEYNSCELDSQKQRSQLRQASANSVIQRVSIKTLTEKVKGKWHLYDALEKNGKSFATPMILTRVQVTFCSRRTGNAP
jgi:hypothetical protein